jgi:hypothetical protein
VSLNAFSRKAVDIARYNPDARLDLTVTQHASRSSSNAVTGQFEKCKATANPLMGPLVNSVKSPVAGLGNLLYKNTEPLELTDREAAGSARRLS